MAFTQTTTEGWGSRIGNSIKGVLFGIILFVAGFPILFMNEGRAVKTAKALKEGAAAVVSIPATDIAAANEGKLVHISGMVDSTAPISDPEFGITAKALKLIRKVEMYQWVEKEETTTKEKAGGSKETTTTYTYEKEWASSVESSSSFKESGHDNPTQMLFNGSEKIADDAKLGAFQIPPRMIERMSSAVDLPVEEGKFTAPASAGSVPPKIDSGRLYFGANPASPAVGDTRVSFLVLNPAVASIIAKQTGSTLEPYATKAGKDLELLEMGNVDAEAMFETAVRNNIMITWIIRFAGFLAMFFGLSMLFQPLVMIAKVVPFLGSLLNVGTGLFAGVIAFVCALVTIAVAWIVFRPILGIALLVIAVGAIVFIVRMPARVKINQPAAEPVNV